MVCAGANYRYRHSPRWRQRGHHCFGVSESTARVAQKSHSRRYGGVSLVAAIKTIILADAVMSLDNVLALAGAAGGDLMHVSLGVLISIPIIVWGSRLVLALMDKSPQVIILGAGLLGWISGGMLVSDIWLEPRIPFPADVTHYVASAVGAMLVVAIGILLKKQKPASNDTRTAQ